MCALCLPNHSPRVGAVFDFCSELRLILLILTRRVVQALPQLLLRLRLPLDVLLDQRLDRAHRSCSYLMQFSDRADISLATAANGLKNSRALIVAPQQLFLLLPGESLHGCLARVLLLLLRLFLLSVDHGLEAVLLLELLLVKDGFVGLGALEAVEKALDGGVGVVRVVEIRLLQVEARRIDLRYLFIGRILLPRSVDRLWLERLLFLLETLLLSTCPDFLLIPFQFLLGQPGFLPLDDVFRLFFLLFYFDDLGAKGPLGVNVAPCLGNQLLLTFGLQDIRLG